MGVWSEEARRFLPPPEAVPVAHRLRRGPERQLGPERRARGQHEGARVVAATVAGEVVQSPVSKANRARFAHHAGAWLAVVQLPPKGAIDYKISREELLHQAVWFVLRGMGLTDKAIATYYNPKALSLSFGSS